MQASRPLNLTGIQPKGRVVVTGASGLVGTRVRRHLEDRYDVVALDMVASAGPRDAAVGALDLTKYPQVEAALRGSDAVVHLAIASERALRHLDPHAYAEQEIRANVLGTRNVFEAAAAAGVRRVVLMSSLTVYFDEPIPKRIDTQTPLQPRNHYAVTKLYGEQLAWLYAAQQKLSVVCWRMGQPYPVDHFKLEHLAEPGARVCAVSSGDISRGVIAGLESDLPEDGRGGLHTGLRPTAGHAVANLVSASDVKPEYGYDLTAGLALGYVPGDRFTAAGPVPNDSEANA